MINTYKDLRGRKWQGDGIPKWIFKLGNESLQDLDPEILELYASQLEQNPDYEMFYFSEDERDNFIKELDRKDVTAAYEKLVPPTYKVDLFKHLLIYYYGGVYMDFSTHALLPLGEIIQDYKQVLSRDFGARDGICAGFIASIPETPLSKAAIERCIFNVSNGLYCRDPLDVTGPRMIGEVYMRLNNINHIATGKITEDLYIYDFKDEEYIYNENIRIVRVRLPNHYQILYGSKNKELYYAPLWHERKIYKPA